MGNIEFISVFISALMIVWYLSILYQTLNKYKESQEFSLLELVVNTLSVVFIRVLIGYFSGY